MALDMAGLCDRHPSVTDGFAAVGSPVMALRHMRRPATASAGGRREARARGPHQGLGGSSGDEDPGKPAVATLIVSPIRVKVLVGGAAWWERINRKVERAARRQQRQEEERRLAVVASRFSSRCGEQVLDARNQLTLWWLQVGLGGAVQRPSARGY
jgi:hypothetical protein